MLKLQNITKRYRGRNIICNFSYVFENSKIYAVVGKSGSGKTTLLKIIAGQDIDYQGLMILDGVIVPKNQMEVSLYRRNTVGYAPQFAQFFESLSGYDNLLIANIGVPIPHPGLPLQVKIHQTVNTLSGGERKRLSIVLSAIRKPQILILDEPTNGLDSHNIAMVMDFIQQRIKGTVIFSTHDREFAEQYADAVIEL